MKFIKEIKINFFINSKVNKKIYSYKLDLKKKRSKMEKFKEHFEL